MAHSVFSRIGSSPLGRAGLATISILALAGVAAGALPLTCKVAPGAVFCGGSDALVDQALGPVEGTLDPAGGATPSSDSASPSHLLPQGEKAITATSDPLAISVEPSAVAQVALLEQAPAPTLTDNDLVAATFEVLRVELTSSQGELTTRKVKSVSINPDGTPVMAEAVNDSALGEQPADDTASSAEPTPTPGPSPQGGGGQETLVAEAGAGPVVSAESVASEAAQPTAEESLAYAPARGDAATVGGKGANVRSLPQKGGSEVLFALTGGAEVTIVEMRKGWAKIVDGQGRSGWIYGQYLRRG